MANYLVTGAAGFIAAKVCGLLLQEGHSVVGVDNLNDAYDVRLKKWRLTQLQANKAFEFHQLDICDRQRLTELFRASAKYEAVINLAARAGVRQSVRDPWVYYETNVTGTLNLLDLCDQFGVQKFVLASTSSLYGERGEQAFCEDLETDRPLSPYAASKKAAETLCFTYHHLKGLDITVFRYFTVYGPAGRPDMSLFRFVQWTSEARTLTVFGDGSQSRDFTYVDDVARGTLLGLRPVGYQVFNLGSDHPISVLEVIRLVEKLLGSKAELRFQPRHPADVSRTWADISKAREILGWEPEWSFEEGTKALVQWYQANRDWAKDIDTLEVS